jgi:DNA-binding CsgD family transcriptional regulator
MIIKYPLFFLIKEKDIKVTPVPIPGIYRLMSIFQRNNLSLSFFGNHFFMKVNSSYYSLFFRFIEKYQPQGFAGIDPNDPLILELEDTMKKNEQFFYIGDLIKLKILFTSKRSLDMMGVKPADLTFYDFFAGTHPDDLKRNSLGRATLLKIANDLYVDGKVKECKLLSSNLRIKNTKGVYSNLLMQMYLYYSTIPHNSVFLLKLHTTIDSYKKIKHGYHYYLGDDLSYFRYPDNELLMTGNVFSTREFEIIKLIAKGYSSEHISEQLFLSLHTVNTHRRNILQKTGKETISELIYELMERGLL